jgi:hypothetical protein
VTGRQQAERRETYLFAATAPLTVVGQADEPVEVAVVEVPMVDEHNPRGLVISHPGGVCPEPEGGCRPRLTARCRSCRVEHVLCTATIFEIRAMMRGGWTCTPCQPSRLAHANGVGL